MLQQNRKPCPAIEGLSEYNAAFIKAVKPCLIANSEHYCSYCDAYKWHDGDLEIEHFRGKTEFPELAATYSNLYAACTSCNRRKKRKSPSIEPLRPDDATYNFDTYFYFEPDTGKILLVDENDRIAKETIDFLNLNHVDLAKARQNFFREGIKTGNRLGKSYRFIPF